MRDARAGRSKQSPLGCASKIHAADCADCETKEGMLDHIKRGGEREEGEEKREIRSRVL